MLPVPLVPDGRTIRQDLSGPNRTAGTAIFIPVTNMLERLNEEIKRRTHVVRIFPNGDSCLRLVRALAVETHENWLEQHRYLKHGRSARVQKGSAATCGLTPDPFSLAPCSLGQGRCAPAPPMPPRWRRHPLTAAARGALPRGSSGRRDGHFRSNKGMRLS